MLSPGQQQAGNQAHSDPEGKRTDLCIQNFWVGFLLMQPIFWEGAVPWSLVLVHPSNLPPGSSLLYVEKDKKRGALCPKWPEPAAPLLSISFLETTQCGNSCLACSSSALAALWAGALFCKVLRLCFV